MLTAFIVTVPFFNGFLDVCVYVGTDWASELVSQVAYAAVPFNISVCVKNLFILSQFAFIPIWFFFVLIIYIFALSPPLSSIVRCSTFIDISFPLRFHLIASMFWVHFLLIIMCTDYLVSIVILCFDGLQLCFHFFFSLHGLMSDENAIEARYHWSMALKLSVQRAEPKLHSKDNTHETTTKNLKRELIDKPQVNHSGIHYSNFYSFI